MRFIKKRVKIGCFRAKITVFAVGQNIREVDINYLLLTGWNGAGLSYSRAD